MRQAELCKAFTSLSAVLRRIADMGLALQFFVPASEKVSESPRMWIEDLADRGGGVDVTIRGILIDLREGSGLVYRCPECRRVLRKGACRIHGEVKGNADLRVNQPLPFRPQMSSNMMQRSFPSSHKHF